MSDRRDEFDDLIDAAARGLVAQDAPGDLRARVDARLRAGDGPSRRLSWAWPGLVAAAAVVAVMALRSGTAPAPRPLSPGVRVAGPIAGSSAPATPAAVPVVPRAVAARAAAPPRALRAQTSRPRPGPATVAEGEPAVGLAALEAEPLEVAPQVTAPLSLAALEIPRVALEPLAAIPELDSGTEER